MKPLQTRQKRSLPSILADSLEVMRTYSAEKIASLEMQLNQLNIGDHSREIILICHEIKKERNVLQQLLNKGAC